MKPGRELDALIAEKVMGWKRLSYAEAIPGCKYPSPERLTQHWHDGLKEVARASHTSCDQCGVDFDAWSPSTNIADAWQVLEKLKMTVSAPTAPYAAGEYANSSTTEWDVEVTRIGASDWSNTVMARALTAPHAICLAALKAAGYNQNSL